MAITTGNRMEPNLLGEGAHTVIRRNPQIGQIIHYETFNKSKESKCLEKYYKV